jgi:3-methyladenine DNA glycosylase AlkD
MGVLFMNPITARLFELGDLSYKEFSKKLIPNLEKDSFIGVRSRDLKGIAKEYSKKEEGLEFLSSLPHSYHDENMVHAYMLGYLKLDTESLKKRLLDFLPFVDNWAVCDTLASCISHQIKGDEWYILLKSLINDSHTYKRRFGIVCLIYFINEKYIDSLVEQIPKIKSEEYYVNMAVAWLISFMLIKEYNTTLPLLKEKRLDPWVHNKAIQKSRESHQISKEIKDYLSTLKIKGFKNEG